MGKKVNTDQASAFSSFPDLVLLSPHLCFFLTSLVWVMKTEYAFCLQQDFFSSDQLPLTGVNNSGTRMRCNAQQTEIRKI